MNALKVLAIDPGGTTGWKIMMTSWDEHKSRWVNLTWREGQMGPHEHHTRLYDFLSREKPVRDDCDFVIILEGFDNRGNPAAVLVSLEYIGVVKLWCKHNEVDYIIQQPAAMDFADDKKLKACKIYVPNLRHSNDAARHLLTWLVNKRSFKPVIRLLQENL